MSEIIIAADDIQEGSDCWDVGAIVTSDGRTLLVHTDVSGPVTLDIFERRSEVQIYQTTFAAGATGPLYDTPQLDSYWGLDLVGYNWRYQVTVAALAAQSATQKGGRTYRHIYRIPTTSHGTIRAIWDWTIIPLPV